MVGKATENSRTYWIYDEMKSTESSVMDLHSKKKRFYVEP